MEETHLFAALIGSKLRIYINHGGAQWHRVDTFVSNEQDPPMEDPSHCSRMCQLCATVGGVSKYHGGHCVHQKMV